jgi:hypothetical protein
VDGWLEGGGSTEASIVWIAPEPATQHSLYAAVDTESAISELDQTNNTQTIAVGGTDLALRLISAIPEPDGSMRVIAQVQNLGAPAAPGSVLAIRRAGEYGTPRPRLRCRFCSRTSWRKWRSICRPEHNRKGKPGIA